MSGLSTVKSCCGCCDLKTVCILIAVLRLLGSIFVLGLFIFVVVIAICGILLNKIERPASENFLRVAAGYGIMVVPLLIINMIFSYWFIQGVHSVRRQLTMLILF